MLASSFKDNHLFFEGSEKKATVHIDPNQISLLNDFDDSFWASLVECCHAKILSKIENLQCKAYLLSESSLFVWDDHFLILTCGETQTINSITFFINSVGKHKIAHVAYQRKNEYFSHAQPTNFGDDTRTLSKFLSGKAYRFGELDSHHNFIFHQDNDFKSNKKDKSYEFLAYGIGELASNTLTKKGLCKNSIRDFLRIENLLPNFTINDFVFNPYGYSLNAIFEDKYLTIHVTPQSDSSYVSVDSNLNLIELAPKLIEILSPASFDLLSFNDASFNVQLQRFIPTSYFSKALVEKTLVNNCYVCFANFVRPVKVFSSPKELNLASENNAL